MRRKLVMIVAALLCGALGTTLLVRFVQGAESRATEGQQQVDVFVVAGDIPAGTTGDAMIEQGLVLTTQVPLKVRPPGSVVSASQILGKVAETDLFVGEQLVVERFVDPNAFDTNPSTVQAPEGFVELTVSMVPSRVMGGFIAPGDTVGIFASFGASETEESESIVNGQAVNLPDEVSSGSAVSVPDTTSILIHKVLVTEIQVEEIPVQRDLSEVGAGAEQPRLAPSGNLLVTLALTTPEAERLIFAIEYGSLYMAQEPEDAPETGTRFQTRATVYESTEPTSAR